MNWTRDFRMYLRERRHGEQYHTCVRTCMLKAYQSTYELGRVSWDELQCRTQEILSNHDAQKIGHEKLSQVPQDFLPSDP